MLHALKGGLRMSRGTGPLVVCGCLSGERHEWGFLATLAMLQEDGWRIHYLGADLPVDAVVEAAWKLLPEGVAFSGSDPSSRARQLSRPSRRLPGSSRRDTMAVIGGGGVEPHARVLRGYGLRLGLEAFTTGRSSSTAVFGGAIVIGRLLGRRPILSEREQDLRAREQELLERLAAALARFGADVEADDLRRFREARDQLAGLFLLVVAGEFNSGKSSFINALLGERVLPEGVTPTTDRINLLRYGARDHGAAPARRSCWSAPIPPSCSARSPSWTRPGTNAIIRRHEELTRDFVPRADLVLFVTSADRPFTESERGFLEQIREWGKKIVFVVNKIDILPRPDDRRAGPRLRARACRRRSWARRPPLSGLRPRGAGGPGGRRPRRSGGERLRRRRGLPRPHARPGGADPAQAAQSAQRGAPARGAVQGRRVRAAEAPGAGRRGDPEHRPASSRCSTRRCCATSSPGSPGWSVLLGDMERRGMRFFEETIRIGRIRSLMDSEGVRRAFEREVIGDTPRPRSRPRPGGSSTGSSSATSRSGRT